MPIAIYAITALLNLSGIGYAFVNLVKHEKQFTNKTMSICDVCYAALAVSVLLNAFVLYRLFINISDYLEAPWKSTVWLTVGGLTLVLQYFVSHICKGVENESRSARLHHGSRWESTR